ncbi:hypothetical protein ElyMa_001002900 [Elysia marginata]|uniref:Uncharacterized protein n=1 Tax=Elysia marginata TaxID=1093978 RepID=A0AAV4HM78_9GAST|nr:hypothetical protein ElyMa_001002900 [Elysia marginata]
MQGIQRIKWHFKVKNEKFESAGRGQKPERRNRNEKIAVGLAHTEDTHFDISFCRHFSGIRRGEDSEEAEEGETLKRHVGLEKAFHKSVALHPANNEWY